MVKYSETDLNRVFQALADPTRRGIVAGLTRGPRTVSEVSRPFAMSLAAVSKHVRRLEEAGLVKRTVKGREHWCALDPRALAAAHDWLGYFEIFWNERLDALNEFLAKSEDGNEKTTGDQHNE